MSSDPLAPPEGYGASPQDWPVPVNSDTCTMDGCQMSSRWLYLLACEHEHIARLNPCDAHAAVLDWHRALVCHAHRKIWDKLPDGSWIGVVGSQICGATMRVERREKLVLTADTL